MRSTLLILFLAAAVVVVWWVKTPDHDSTLKTSPNSSEVSEHDWAKQALDRTADVKWQIAQQRKEEQDN